MMTPFDFSKMIPTAASGVAAKSSIRTSSSLTTKCLRHASTTGGQQSPSNTSGRGSMTRV
jgi:hypothetical protein